MRLAMLPQSPQALFRYDTVWEEFLESAVAGWKEEAARQKAEEMAAFLELDGKKFSHPYDLSGGEMQRAAVGKLLLQRADILLMDEPTKGLDETACGVVYENLQKIKTSQSLGMLIITHDLQLARSICADIAVMYAGQIVEYGPQVLTGPRHPYTQAFLAALPENGFQPLPGLPPLPQNHLPGCRFAPRCPSCQKRCLQEVPPVYDSGTAKVRCFLYA